MKNNSHENWKIQQPNFYLVNAKGVKEIINLKFLPVNKNTEMFFLANKIFKKLYEINLPMYIKPKTILNKTFENFISP